MSLTKAQRELVRKALDTVHAGVHPRYALVALMNDLHRLELTRQE